MVFIEVAEVDAPEYEQQKLKKNPKSTSSVTPEAASHKSGSLPVEEKDTSVSVSSEGTNMPDKGGEFSDSPDELLINAVIATFPGLFL